MSDRAGKNAARILQSFDCILQLDDYTGYDRVNRPFRAGGAPITTAHCWAHVRRKLKEIFDRDGSEIAAEGLRRIAQLYRIEAEIHSMDPGQRLSVRQVRTAPLVAALSERLQVQCRRVSIRQLPDEKWPISTAIGTSCRPPCATSETRSTPIMSTT